MMEHGHESPLQIEVSRHGVVAMVTVTGALDITTAAASAQADGRHVSAENGETEAA